MKPTYKMRKGTPLNLLRGLVLTSVVDTPLLALDQDLNLPSFNIMEKNNIKKQFGLHTAALRESQDFIEVSYTYLI